MMEIHSQPDNQPFEDIRNSTLFKEHQTRALLIKIACTLLAGFSLIVVSTLWMNDANNRTFLLAKIGINIWLISALGLILAANTWLQYEVGLPLTARRVFKVSLVSVLICILLSVRAIPQNTLRALLDLASSLIGGLVLFASKRASESQGTDHAKAKELGIARALLIARIVNFAWLLAAMMLLIASVLWLSSREVASAVGVLFPAIIALTIFLQSIRIIGIRSPHNIEAESESANEQNLPARLNDIASRSHGAAKAVMFCCGLVLALALGFKVTNPVESVSTTVVAAAIGFVASIMALLIEIVPIFADRLTVFATSNGTQHVYPIELLLQETIAGEVGKISTAVRDPSAAITGGSEH